MLKRISQEKVVFALTIILFAAFAFTLPRFLELDNLLLLLRSVSILGILGIAMVIVVIGRGIDLSLVVNMAMSVAWCLTLIQNGMSVPLGIAMGLGLALLIGVINGLFIAYAEISPLFCTLAIGTFLYGFGRFQLVPLDVVPVPDNIGWMREIGAGTLLGIPTPIIVTGVIALAVFLFLRYSKYGQFTYAMGDNFRATRIAGAPVRPAQVAQYMLSAVIAFAAGLVAATSVSSMSTRVVNSTLIYDVILVVVLGGVGLSGGKGNVRNVLIGTLLIGTLQDGMTIMDVQYTTQRIVKSAILLVALIADSLLNPRDEQTDQQGDI
jgi:ribose transport system permease protein